MLLTPLRNEISKYQAQYPNNLEVEVRYGAWIQPEDKQKKGDQTKGNIIGQRFTKPKPYFRPGISLQTFSRLQQNLDGISPNFITTRSHDETDKNGIRHTVYSDGTQVWINKPRALYEHNIQEYGIRVTATQEFTVEPVKDFKPNYRRDKIRYSYPLAGGAVRADLTRVTSEKYDAGRWGSQRTSYEIELELIQTNAFDAFSRAAESILRLIQDTVILYTERDRKEITAYFNFLLAGHDDDKILDHSVMKQSRNLKLRDMVWGGLLGNQQTAYTVTHKTDGLRKLLVFGPNGIWLLHPPFDYTRLTSDRFPTMEGTVLDGESVPKNKRKEHAPKEQYWYLVFDTLAWEGDKGIQKQPFNDRMNLSQTAVNRISLPYLAINTKKIRSFDTPRRFFEVMRDLFEEQKILAYEQDGFVFTPGTAEYDPKYPLTDPQGNTQIISIDRHPLHERTLTRYADNLKWKEIANLTIDFLIRKTEKGLTLYVLENKELVLFTGNREYPFPGYLKDIPPILRETPDNSIVEFSWNSVTNTFEVVLIRTNKTKPNRLEIARDVWEDIHHPVTAELLQGKTFGLMDYYHQRIRRGLLYTPNRQEKLLLINPHSWSYIEQWQRYRSTLIVESDPILRQEFQGKAVAINKEGRGNVSVSNSPGDLGTLNQITTEKFDVIALFNDVGSYWQSPEALDQFVAIIKKFLTPTGRLVFFFLDGDACQEMFRPAYTPEFDIKGLDLGPALLSYNQGDNLLITNYKGSTLEDKVEYPLFIYDLVTRLPGWHLSEIYRSDTEDFLSLPEKMFSRLYSFGLLESNGHDLPPRSALPQSAVRQDKSQGLGRPEIPAKVEIRPDIPVSPKPVNSPTLLVTPTTQSTRGRALPIRTRVASNTVRGAPTGRGGLTRPVPRRPVEFPLRTLTVITPRNKENPGIGDDKVERVTVTWTTEEVYRIACIGDGSCFFHGYLKGFYAPYQNNSSYAFRYDTVRNFRDELASLIAEEDPDNEGFLFYDTAADGAWARMAEQQLLLEKPLVDDFNEPLDYSLEGMIRLFLATRDVGDETYSFISEIIGIGVYIVRGTNKDLYPQIAVGIENPSVVIMGNGHHYELIAVKRQEGFQTLFDPDDPFIRSLRALQGTEGLAAVNPKVV